MKLHILGSGGGEGYPALFCNCVRCNAARKAGGKIHPYAFAVFDRRSIVN